MAATFPIANGSPASPRNGRHAGGMGQGVLRGWTDGWRWWRGEIGKVAAPLIDRYWVDRSRLVELPASSMIGDVLDERLKATLRGRDVHIRLDATQVLRKRIEYPAAVEENLIDVLANDMDRQTPFAADQVYFAQRIARRFDSAEQGPRIEVELALLLRRTLDPLLAAVRQAGGSVRSIALGTGEASFEFLPAQERPPQRLTTMQKVNLALAALLVLLIAAAAAVPAVWKRMEMARLTPQVDKARGEAEATRKIEAEYQRLLNEYQLATQRKQAAYPLLDIVEELTRLSPDTTWLKGLEMKSAGKNKTTREVILTGEAVSASKMIELLEQSALLQNTTQRAQTTRAAQSNTEQFQVSSEVKPRALPAAVGLDELTAKPAVAPAASAGAPTAPAGFAVPPPGPVAPAAPITAPAAKSPPPAASSPASPVPMPPAGGAVKPVSPSAPKA